MNKTSSNVTGKGMSPGSMAYCRTPSDHTVAEITGG